MKLTLTFDDVDQSMATHLPSLALCLYHGSLDEDAVRGAIENTNSFVESAKLLQALDAVLDGSAASFSVFAAEAEQKETTHSAMYTDLAELLQNMRMQIHGVRLKHEEPG